MAQITLKGNPFNTCGELPKIGQDAPDFKLVKADLSEVSKGDLAGKRIILNIFPSLDTPVCAQSIRTFNKRASEAANTQVVCISMDLPFAFGRFCSTEGLENVISASAFRAAEFGQSYGTTIVDGPLKGLMARSIVVIDEKGIVRYTQLVKEVAEEPNYDQALASLK